MTTTMLPLALSQIDVKAFYERFVTIAGKPTRHYREGLEWACSCPVCGGTDRASFFASGRFVCVRGTCKNAHASSPYWFLRDVLHYDHSQACFELGLDPLEVFGKSFSKLPLFLVRDEAPGKLWQEAAHAFCQAAEK